MTLLYSLHLPPVIALLLLLLTTVPGDMFVGRAETVLGF